MRALGDGRLRLGVVVESTSSSLVISGNTEYTCLPQTRISSSTKLSLLEFLDSIENRDLEVGGGW